MLNFLRAVPKSRKVRIKKSRGIIFSNPSGQRKAIFYIANMLLFGALIYGGYLYTPLISAVYNYKFSNNSTNNPEIIASEQISDEYIIQIPKILAYSKVIENVSPFDKAEYDRVLVNNVVAQSRGSAKPGSGKGNSTYIFAHSTNNSLGMVRSNAVFYLLGELQENDMIYVNYHGNEIKYRVYEKNIVSAKELKYLEYSDESRDVLILQTCWPIGTDWNRLLILAELVE